MFVNVVTWGPMVILGLFALSDVIPYAGYLYLRHGLSNLMIPAHIYAAYLLFEFAVNESDWQSWAKFVVFVIHGLSFFSLQFNNGTDAMYAMYEDPNYNDYNLYPSIFYFLNWIEHNARNDQDDYWNYYY